MCIVAVLAKSLIQAAVALGIGSAALPMLLFLLNAPHAAGFELRAGAGWRESTGLCPFAPGCGFEYNYPISTSEP